MTDNMPDFDNMTQEQIMAWMESLARRQGADESGFTTKADLDVPEIDPNSVDTSQLGEYIPYGMSKADWEAQLAREAAEKEARKATQAPKVAPPVKAAPPPPAPAPQPVASADATPDFDSMTPEQLMEWMESLAKRQGVSDEQLTTKASMKVAEVDPNSVDVASLNTYKPYGWSDEQWEAQQKKEAAEREARQKTKSATPPAAITPPPAAPQEFDILKAPSLDDLFAPAEPTTEAVVSDFDVLEAPSLDDLFSAMDSLDQAAPVLDFPTDSAVDDPMAWLASLSSDSVADLPDLSALDSDAMGDFDLPGADAMSWLDEVANNAGGAAPSAVEPEVDPMLFMESLARRQGADPEELMTTADLDIPMPAAPASREPGYKAYRFEEGDDAPSDFAPDELDPAAWLDSLASGDLEDTEEDLPPADVMAALNRGEDISPDTMQKFFEAQFKRAETRDDQFDLDETELEADPVPAEIPDWLKEQMAPPAPVPAPHLEDAADLEELFAEEEEELVAEMPDWLRDDIGDSGDIQSDIFEPSSTPVSASTKPVANFEVDTSDPWVEAFVMENEKAEEMAAWYKRQVQQTDGDHDTAPQAPTAVPTLHKADLPLEADLPAGQPEAIPAWLDESGDASGFPVAMDDLEVVDIPGWLAEEAGVSSGDEDVPDWIKGQVVEESPTSDLPEWLREVDVPIAVDEIPEWLRETMDEEPAPTLTAPTSAPVPVTVAPPAPAPKLVPVAASPAPVPAMATQIDLTQTLQAARHKVSGGDLDGAILDYEAIIRANIGLDMVVKDLSGLLEHQAHKQNPAVYRVLGDGLMRQGKLQMALDTYRKALNLL